jgi:hypothetical protein
MGTVFERASGRCFPRRVESTRIALGISSVKGWAMRHIGMSEVQTLIIFLLGGRLPAHLIM